MEENILNYLAKLDGIQYGEWQRLKVILDNKYAELKYKSTFKLDESTLENLKAICQ